MNSALNEHVTQETSGKGPNLVRERFHETRLMLPIALVWLALFAGAMYFACYWFVGVGYWPDFLLFTISAIGLLGASYWLGLYGERFVRRTLFVPLLTSLVAGPATWVYCFLRGERFDNPNYWMLPILIVGASFVLTLIVAGCRYLFGWRIVSAQELNDRARPKLTIAVLLAVTLIVALLLTVLKSLSIDFMDRMGLWVSVLVVPVLWSAGTLAISGRFSVRLAWAAALCLAVVASTASIGCWALEMGWMPGMPRGPRGELTPVTRFFVPQVACYLGASLLAVLTAAHLRSRGVVFLCGGKRGFAAPIPYDQPGVWSRTPARYAAGFAALLLIGFVGWRAYWGWQLSRPIPEAPTVGDLPRLFELASAQPGQLQQSVRDVPPAAYKRRSQRESDGASRANQAIVLVGREAIPFLLKKTNVGQLVDSPMSAAGHRTRTAWSLLGRIARELGFGDYKGDVIAAVKELDSLGHAMGVFVAMPDDATKIVLERLKSKDPQKAFDAAGIIGRYGGDYDDETVHAVAQAALAPRNGPYPLHRMIGSLVRIGGDRAAPTLLTILNDEEAFSEQDRAAAAESLSTLAVDASTVVAPIQYLLVASKDNEVRRQAMKSLGNLGTAASAAAPLLSEIFAARASSTPTTVNGAQGPNDGSSYGAGPPNAGGYGSYGAYGGGYDGGPNLDAPEFEWVAAMTALGRIQAAEAVPHVAAVAFEESWNAEIKLLAVQSLGAIGAAAKPYSANIKELAESESAADMAIRMRTTAMIALTRIHLDRAEEIVPVLLGQLQRGRVAVAEATRRISAYDPARSEAMQVEATLQTARLVCLMWLGSRGDQQIMRLRDESAEGPYAWSRSSSPLSPNVDQAAATLFAFRVNDVTGWGYGDDIAGMLNPEEWTLPGRILSLTNAMETALASSDDADRAIAADILGALAHRFAYSFPRALLQEHSDDESARVRAHVAAGLVLSGEEVKKHRDSLVAGVDEMGDATPALIRLLLAEAIPSDEELRRIRQNSPY